MLVTSSDNDCSIHLRKAVERKTPGFPDLPPHVGRTPGLWPTLQDASAWPTVLKQGLTMSLAGVFRFVGQTNTSLVGLVRPHLHSLTSNEQCQLPSARGQLPGRAE
jgi:hypothetical protein